MSFSIMPILDLCCGRLEILDDYNINQWTKCEFAKLELHRQTKLLCLGRAILLTKVYICTKADVEICSGIVFSSLQYMLGGSATLDKCFSIMGLYEWWRLSTGYCGNLIDSSDLDYMYLMQSSNRDKT